MKKSLLLFLSALVIFVSCENEDTYQTYDLSIRLDYSGTNNISPEKDVKIILTSANGIIFESITDENGEAKFEVPAGIYEASVSERRAIEGYVYNLNGITSGIVVSSGWNPDKAVCIKLVESRFGQLVIKELYVGGTPKDDGSGIYHMDKYFVIYNNSDEIADIKNFCIGMASPFNAQGNNLDYIDGKLSYENKGYIPAINAIWYLEKNMILEPGEDAVIALNGAINQKLTYSKSVDLSRADYVTYDLDDFDNPKYHPVPSEYIPVENYFKAYKYGLGNSWPISTLSPAFYIFTTGEKNPAEYAAINDYHYCGNKVDDIYKCVKIPTEWIIDAIEVYDSDNLDKSHKRLTPAIDAGYVIHKRGLGYSIYRNVDKEATEALESNNGKIVYNNTHGTDVSSDPSNIDAEASLNNGARIIYQDTNNSSKDFHMRDRATMNE